MSYILKDDGTVIFHFKDITRTVRRPTLGEYRQLVESLGGGVTGNSLHIKIDKVLEWWDKVLVTLAGEGLPRTKAPRLDDDGNEVLVDGKPVLDEVIDEAKLEPWIIGDRAMVELLAHWQAVPSPPGDR